MGKHIMAWVLLFLVAALSQAVGLPLSQNFLVLIS